jgi:hypothetical protein
VARAADEEVEGGIAELGSRMEYRGPELSQRRSGRLEAESFTVRSVESNSTEQALSVVNWRMERRLWMI